MNNEIAAALEDCTQDGLGGVRAFPEIVQQLAQIGVERYHVDYSRQEMTYYFPDGASLVVNMPLSVNETGATFSASAVAAAVRQSQQNEHSYVDFIRKTMAAGCVGYFVQIAGRRVIYSGRNGESHVELFPSAPIVVEESVHSSNTGQ